MGKNDELLRKAVELMGEEELTEALTLMVQEKRGELGFLLGELKKRPRHFNPYILKGLSVYAEPVALDVKTVELVAVGASTALGCEHCLEAHMGQAISKGASLDEVKDAIFVAAAITESSALSVAMRKFRQKEVALRREQKRTSGD